MGTPQEREGGSIFLRNAVEANLLEAMLRDAGIPHYVKVYRDPSFKGSWNFIDAWGHVECPVEHEEEVRELLAGLRGSGG